MLCFLKRANKSVEWSEITFSVVFFLVTLCFEILKTASTRLALLYIYLVNKLKGHYRGP